MIEITESEVRELTNDIVFTRGLKAYKEGSITTFNFEKLDSFGGIEDIRIRGSVKASDNGEYSTLILLNSIFGLDNSFCSCRAFHKYNGPCKHVIALLLKYINESEKMIQREKERRFNNFIEKLRINMSIINKGKRELNLDVKLCISDFKAVNEYYMELKVGEDKKYVVKNIRNFMEIIDKRGVLEFGKCFTYDYKIHKFNEVDKKIIDILKEVYEIDIKYAQNHNHFGNFQKLLKGKKAILTSLQVKRLLGVLKDREFDGELFGEKLTNIKIIEEDIPFNFRIQNNDDKIVIKQAVKSPRPLINDGEYFLYENLIYKPTYKQRELYRDFYNMMDENEEIYLEQSKTKDLASYMIPALKEISPKLEIDHEIEKIFVNKPLRASVYFDKIDEIIAASMRFEYGDIMINPLRTNLNFDKKVPVRNINKEVEIINIVKDYGFIEDNNNFVLCEEENLLTFITEGIIKLQDAAEVYYSDEFKKIKVYTTSNISTSIKLNENDLLEFTFDIEGVEKSELKDIFEAVRIKKKYYRLRNGGFLHLDSEGIKDIVDTVDYLDIKNKDLLQNKVLLSKYNSIYLDEKLKNSEIKFERNKCFRETINGIKEVTEADFEIPKSLQGVLREYQKVGFKWLKTLATYGFGGILADEMGLGKTLQAIAFIAAGREEDEEKKPVLVVCPTSLVYNWESEIQKFANQLKTLVISGNKEVRSNKIKELDDFDVVITSYPLIRNDIEFYKNTKFRYCFLDEAQHIKNYGSQSAKAVKEIKAKGYFAMTGTPIENSLTELWSIFDFIMPGYLLNHNKFTQIYETPIIKKNDEKALIELNKRVKPFILRRLKKDVIRELPSKIEHKILIDMNTEQKKLYASYVTALKEEIEKEIDTLGFNNSKLKILAALTRLRQICCEPSIFIENYKGESAKMAALMEILEGSIDGNHRILVFSQFTSALKKMEEQLRSRNIEYMYLDGKTKSKDRIYMVNNFNNGEGKVFLISLKAGGTGLNLTGADMVIHFDPWWNPAVEEQASDRAHRIGQKKTVEVIKLITKGTIEEKINILQEKKKNIINNVLQNASEKNVISKMNREEIKELFSY